MSQYPNSPYSTPQPFQHGYAADPYGAYLAPAKRASVLMIVIGGLICAYGLCNGLMNFFASAEALTKSSREFFGNDSPISLEVARTVGVISSSLMLLAGLAHIGIGIQVAKARPTAIILGMVLTGILGAMNGFFLLIAIVGVLINPLMFIFAFGLLIPLAVLIWQFIWLLGARKAGDHLINAQLHYQQQYAQYQQHQQMYGYGYAQPQQPGDTNGPSSAR